MSEEWYTVGTMTNLEDPQSTFSTMLLIGSPEDLEAPLLLARMLAREPSAYRTFVSQVACAQAVAARDTIPAPAGA
jgi:hypothetical protein